MAASSTVFGWQPEVVGGDDGANDGGAGSAGGGAAQGGGGGWAGGGQGQEGGGGWWAAGGGGWQGHDWQKGRGGGGGGQAGGDDGQQQAGGAGPPVPVEFELTDQDVWQACLGDGQWVDAAATWTEPLFQALRDGVPTIRLMRIHRNKFGEEVHCWYTIDCADSTDIQQQNEASGTRRELRVVQLMAPRLVEPHAPAAPPPALPPPLEQPAAPAGSEAELPGGGV